MKTSFPRMKKTETQEKTGRRIRRTRRRRRTKKRYVRHTSLIFYCPYTHSGDAIIVKIKGHSQRTRRPGIRHRSMDRLLWEDGKKFRADRNLHFPKSVNKDSLLGEDGKKFLANGNLHFPESGTKLSILQRLILFLQNFLCYCVFSKDTVAQDSLPLAVRWA